MSASVGYHAKSTVTGSALVNNSSGGTTQVSGSSFYISIAWVSASATVPAITGKIGGVADGNTYTQVQSTVTGTVASYHVAIFKCELGHGGASHVFTATWGAAVDVSTMFIIEVLNGAATSPTDQAPAGLLDQASPYTSNVTGTTAQADELALAFAYTGSSSGTEVLAWGNSFAALDAEGNANSAMTGGTATLSLVSIGTYQSSFTSSGGGTTEAISFILTVKSAGSTAMSIPTYSSYVTA